MKQKKLIVGIGLLLVFVIALVVFRLFRVEPEKEFVSPLEVVTEKEFVSPLEVVTEKEFPVFSDHGETDRLAKAVRHQINALARKRRDEPARWGDQTVTQERLLRTLELFEKLLNDVGLQALLDRIPDYFTVYQASGQNRKGDVLFTAYYQPIIEARHKSDEIFRYPLYAVPPDMQVFDLGTVNPDFSGERIALQVEKGKVKPYYDRKDIDGNGALAGRGLELYYLGDCIDRYMLHVQGSGILKLENEDSVKVGYAGTNYFPYVSVGKELIRDNVISASAMSLQAIRDHFTEHPEQTAAYLNRNRRYIFFRETSGEVQGSEGVELTARRSIATDKRLFPGGGLAFIICQKIVRSPEGDAIGSEPFNRFVLDQDTGSAMKGPGRVDIFWGTGDKAGEEAGCFMETGQLYYLLIKE